ncbi:DUF943 family protein [Xenorhabdus sp. 18]|nr:DUF943 family protein [Xenorhabdus sp. 18]
MYILVRHFPITDRGKINWWEKNKAMLKDKYGIPVTDKKGYITMTTSPKIQSW